jgi:hypothetical protein
MQLRNVKATEDGRTIRIEATVVVDFDALIAAIPAQVLLDLVAHAIGHLLQRVEG